MTGYPSLDWYVPQPIKVVSANIFDQFFTGATLHLVEVLIMLFSLYIHRNFPREFSLSTEIGLNLFVGWILDTVIEVKPKLLSEPLQEVCFCYMIRFDAFLDILRCFAFIVIIYVITMKSFTTFPLPYTWVFKDFTKFLFEPKCVAVFMKYIQKKEPEKLETITKMMDLFVSEFDKERTSNASSKSYLLAPGTFAATGTIFMSGFRPTEGINAPNANATSNRYQFLELVNKLEPSFNRFKTTKSANQLHNRLKEFEDITEHAATMW